MHLKLLDGVEHVDDNIFMLDAHAIGNGHSHRRSAEMVVIYATSMVVAARARRCLINQEPQAEGGVVENCSQ